MPGIDSAGVLVYDGFESLDAFGPFEVLSAGADRGPGFEVSLVSVDPAETVRSGDGATVVPGSTVGATDPDLLVVPGGGWNDRADSGAWAEAERGVVPDLLADLAGAGTTVAGVCSGGMLLARAGLLDGRPAVTHRGALEDLAATGADVVGARVVDAGDVLTAGGVTSGLDLALYLLEREFGSALAVTVEEYLEYERRGTVYDAA
jgi:transcriptional regulator GlxA family with amidase domain